ncbi:hypothetical protein KY289_020813 [Solanum tuberosum]|nr:hypothetical protein KY289_020813 [Solanum tuberosum]
MAKAYDRVSWFFLMKVLRKMGYGMPKWSANLNHLAYADDTIIFSSTQNYSLGKIMTVLQDYEKQSGQKDVLSLILGKGRNIILICLKKSEPSEHRYKPWWTKSSTGNFSVKSSWELLRQKADINEDLKRLWIKGLPFKFSFLAWRIWNEEETIEHLFLTGKVAIKIWNHYFRATGLIGPMLNLKQIMRRWWSSEGPSSAVFCIRDHSGSLVVAKGFKLQDTTNLILEVRWDIPWSVSLEITSINYFRSFVIARVQHSFREGNTLADYFANLVFDFAAQHRWLSIGVVVDGKFIKECIDLEWEG